MRCAHPTGALRLGFTYVKGLGDAACERLEAEAERVVSGNAPYTSLRDFCARTRLDRRSVERLVAVGAFDSLGRPRRELLWELPAILDELRAGELPGLAVEPGAAPPLDSLTDLEAADLDYRLLGLSPDRHAMEFYRPTLAGQGVRTADELPDLPTGRVVRVAGLVICRQAPPTAGGHVFLTLEDETGLANVIVRPQVYQAQRAAIRNQPALVVEGPLQNQDGAISVMARRCTPLRREHLAGTVRSRDFH